MVQRIVRVALPVWAMSVLSAVLSVPVWAQAEGAAPSAGPRLDAVKAAASAEKLAAEVLNKPADVFSRLSDKALDWAADRGPGIIAALFLLVLGWMLAGWVRRMVVRGCAKANFDLTLGKFLANLARWAVLVFVVITCLGTLNISVTGFAAILGAAGLAIGLALQGNLSNLASGVLLLIFRPFKIGDSVIVAGQTGVIDGIDLFTTNLDTGDNRRIIVPNSAIFGGVIENQTRHPWRRVSISVPVSGSADLDQTARVLKDAVDRVVRSAPGVLSEPAPSVTLADLQPGVTWQLALTAETPKHASVRQALLREVKLAIDAAGIAPPPPSMHVMLKQS
jgi:small conductance mechanosensitive channel